MVINTMGKVVPFLLLALTVAGMAEAFTVDPVAARRHAEAVRATYPRPEASPGEADLASYIRRIAADSGLEAGTIGFSGSAAGHSFSQLVEVVVPGSGTGTVIIVAPLNHPEGASPDEDRSASVAAALSVMESVASAGPHRPTFRFLFPGAEYGVAPDYPKGTRRYLEIYIAEEPHALLYLDADRSPPVIETGGGGRVTPQWLVHRSVDAAYASGVRPQMSVNMSQLHRLGISDAPAALTAFLQAGIPAVYLRSGDSGSAPPSVSAESGRLAVLTAEWAGSFSAGVPDTWDRNYLSFRIGSQHIVVGEQHLLIVLLGLIMSAMLYAFVFPRRFNRYARTIMRNAWNLPVLFALAFGFLTAATYLLELAIIARRFPTVWTWYPSIYFGLKIALSSFLFSVAAQLLRLLPLSKNGSFYSASALVVLFIDIILFSVISLSLSYYFMWAYFWAFVFSVVRSRTLKVASLVLAPLFLVLLAVDVFRVPELRLAEELLLSTRGNLLLSFMILPFLLMLIRLDFLVRHPVRGRRSFALRMASTVSGVAVIGLLVFALVSTPFSPANPQPVRAVETVDYPELARSLSITGPAPLGDIRVLFAGEEHAVSVPGRAHAISTTRMPDVLSVRLSYEDFLERDRARLEIDAPQPIDDVSILLTSPEPMIIYDVSYPFTISADRRTAIISVGRRPPLPLVVDFTLARGIAPTIEIEAESAVHPEPLEITGSGLDVQSRLRIRTRLGP